MGAFAEALEAAFGERLRGAYLHGSIALGAFDPVSSDADFLIVLDSIPSAADERRIADLHRQLQRRHGAARKLEGIYVAATDLAARDLESPRPYVKHGRLRGKGHRFGATARHMVREHGVALAGPEPRELVPAVPRGDIDAEMDFNLNVYWHGRQRQAYRFLFDAGVDFAVLTIGRILHTLENGTMISKRAAADYLDARFAEWRPLVGEVRGRFHPDRRSPGPFARPLRAVRTYRFVDSMIAFANERYRLPVVRRRLAVRAEGTGERGNEP